MNLCFLSAFHVACLPKPSAEILQSAICIMILLKAIGRYVILGRMTLSNSRCWHWIKCCWCLHMLGTFHVKQLKGITWEQGWSMLCTRLHKAPLDVLRTCFAALAFVRSLAECRTWSRMHCKLPLHCCKVKWSCSQIQAWNTTFSKRDTIHVRYI